MTAGSATLRNATVGIIMAAFAVTLGFVYVNLFTAGTKLIVVFHAIVLFFLGCAVFLKQLRSFAVFTMIAAIHLKLDFYLLFAPVDERYVGTPFNTGINIDLMDILLGALFFQWIAAASVGRLGERVRLGSPLGPLLLMWIFYSAVAGVLVAEHPQYTLFEVFLLGKGFLLYFYLINSTKTQFDYKIIVYALIAGAAAHGLFMTLQFATGMNYTLTGDFYPVKGPEGFRSGGFFGNNEAAAQMLTITLPVALACMLFAMRGIRRVPLMASILVILLGLLATKYRAAWLSVFIGVAAFYVVGFISGRVSQAQILKAGAWVVVILLVISPFIYQRFSVGSKGEVRAPLIATALEMIEDHRFFGVGANNYLFHIAEYTPVKFRYEWSHIVHNEYLLHVAERGIFGALLYYGLILVMLRRLWRLRRSDDPWIAAVSIGLFSGMVGSLLHRMTTIYHFAPFFLFFCVTLALIPISERLQSELEEESTNKPDDRTAVKANAKRPRSKVNHASVRETHRHDGPKLL